MRLVWPAPEHLDSYAAALKAGWGPNNVRVVESARDELAMISADPTAFLSSLDLRDSSGVTVTLPDGRKVPRLPGFRKWLWDGEFCGSIGFRWQTGTEALPDYCLGHIGYSVVPWKRNRGYATEALRQLLPEAKALGMKYVELTTEPGNPESQKVITANGGVMIGEFVKPAVYGGGPGLRFRILLSDGHCVL